MKNPYRKKNRAVRVKVWLTADQIAVLLNRAMYNERPLDLSAEAQFVLDWACSDAGGFHEVSAELGRYALSFDPDRLPDPQGM